MYARHKGGIKKDAPDASTYHATQRGVDARRVAQMRMSVPAPTNESEGEWVYQRRSKCRKGEGAINNGQRTRNPGRKRKPRNARKKETMGKRETQFLTVGECRNEMRETYRYGGYTALLWGCDSGKRESKRRKRNDIYKQSLSMCRVEMRLDENRRSRIPPD